MPAGRNPTLIPLPIILFAWCWRPLSCHGRAFYKNSKWPNSTPGNTKLSARRRRVDCCLGICASFLPAVWASLASAFVSSGLHFPYGEMYGVIYRSALLTQLNVVIREHRPCLLSQQKIFTSTLCHNSVSHLESLQSSRKRYVSTLIQTVGFEFHWH